jgi:hypothetical protein
MNVLRLGQSGPEVESWQHFLIGQDINVLADGSFGPGTQAGTVAFQEKYGLGADGVVGRGTLAKAMELGFGEVHDEGAPEEESPKWPPPPDFGPLSGADRIKLFGQFAYEPAPTQWNPEAILIRDNWAAVNLVQVEIPQLVGVQGAGTSGKIAFHKAAAAQLQALWQAWEDAGLLPLVLSWGGSYAPRFVRGSRTYLSNHAWATAFDINVPQNGLGVEPALVGKKGSVRKLVPLAVEHGFYWGGWYGRKDGMHFEVASVK